MKGVGLYCTVCSEELAIALATLSHSVKSKCVRCIVIILTDALYECEFQLNDKMLLFTRNYGKGFDISIEHGGYDQISARNFSLDVLEKYSDSDWVMQHDADDLYVSECYEYIVNKCEHYDALACSCFTLKDINTLCAAPGKKRSAHSGKYLYNPHIRIWKKHYRFRYEKSKEIGKYFHNHSRHCGISFPGSMNIGIIDQAWHFHLHALLDKRHSKEIKEYPFVNIEIPQEIKSFLQKIKYRLVN